jgi:uncharacterized protein YoxC
MFLLLPVVVAVALAVLVVGVVGAIKQTQVLVFHPAQRA